MSSIELQRAEGRVRVEELGDGRRVVSVHADKPGAHVARATWTTRYPPELVESVLDVKGLAHVCDEIARDEDPDYVERHVRQVTC